MTKHGRKSYWAALLLLLMSLQSPWMSTAEPTLVGRDYLLVGRSVNEQTPVRACSPEALATLRNHVEIPAPAAGWSGTPQAVDVFNVFAGEVMISQGDRQICGHMQDARTRDSRFRAGIGLVVVPKAGSVEPIRVAWTSPVKSRWVPTVRLGAPSPLQQVDTARLLVRTACIVVVIALALTALMGFLTTRDRRFLTSAVVCIVLIAWQAVLSGLSGYPEPWLPVGRHANQWLIVLSALSLSAVAMILWRLCGGAQVLSGSRRWVQGFSWSMLAVALATPWLPWTLLTWTADILSAALLLTSLVGFAVGLVSLRRRDYDALDGVAGVLPMLILAVADLAGSRVLIEYRVEAMQLAVTWFLMMSAYALTRRLGHLRRQRDEMRQLADTDVLTGLPNRRAGLRQLESYVVRARAKNQPLSIGFLDVDLFKQINDRYGHEIGDEVLVAVANILSASIRSRDDVIRIGGEEFLVLLPGASGKVALQRLNQLREQVMQVANGLPHEGLQVTVSIGLAELGAGMDDVRGLLRRADKAMYSAKRAGRNCVYEAPLFKVAS